MIRRLLGGLIAGLVLAAVLVVRASLGEGAQFDDRLLVSGITAAAAGALLALGALAYFYPIGARQRQVEALTGGMAATFRRAPGIVDVIAARNDLERETVYDIVGPRGVLSCDPAGISIWAGSRNQPRALTIFAWTQIREIRIGGTDAARTLTVVLAASTTAETGRFEAALSRRFWGALPCRVGELEAWVELARERGTGPQ